MQIQLCSIYRWCPYISTQCKLLFLQTQALLADYSTKVSHTCPLTFNNSYNLFKVERKFEFILENARGCLAVAR